MYIEKINGPEDVKKIEVSELPKLAEEMRHALLIRASKHGGHLSFQYTSLLTLLFFPG